MQVCTPLWKGAKASEVREHIENIGSGGPGNLDVFSPMEGWSLTRKCRRASIEMEPLWTRRQLTLHTKMASLREVEELGNKSLRRPSVKAKLGTRRKWRS